MPVKVIGADVVAREFEKISNISYADFINVISQTSLSLFRNNSPVDTGELQRSWRELYKSDRTLGIGVDPSQLIKLRSIVFGTRYTKPNDFITPIVNVIFDNIKLILNSHIESSHQYFNRGRTTNVASLSNIVGLTGTKFTKTRQTGRGGRIYSLRTGRKSLTKTAGKLRRKTRQTFNP